MSSYHFPIRVPAEMLEALGAFTGHFWSDTLALEPFICEAITNYMNPAPAPQPQATLATQATQSSEPSELGYQWKEVFLPEGTKLRASFGRQPYFATVRGTEIKYGEHAVSPSCFANLYGSGNRNAWKAVWLRLPGSDTWLLADKCRAVQNAAMTRLLTGDTRQKSLPEDETTHLPVSVPVSAAIAAPAHPAARQTRPSLQSVPQARPPGKAAQLAADAKPSNIAGKSARRRKRRAKKRAPANL
jgi:hypothetical protein